MKAEELIRAAIITFILAVVIYFGSFKFIEHRRTTKGPWVVEFRTDTNGTPEIVVSQEKLNIRDQRFVFPEQKLPQTNLSETVLFNGPNTKAPFGEVVFQDPTFLPGTVMFNFWGHGVELLPRTMVVNQEEIPWNTKTNIVLTGPGKFERRPVKKPFFL